MESQGVSPPLGATEELFQLRSSDGQNIHPELMGKIEKGFFLAEGDWTCYRRNYFSLTCSYTLQPSCSPQSIHVMRQGSSAQVYAFAMSISAVVDERDGKAIELVQHTPKRDKGPLATPDRVVLAPRPASSSLYGSPGDVMSSSQSLFEPRGFQHAPQQPPTEYTFDRIQFKQATANNGKRRAAQQYYHLLVELYADTGVQMGEHRWLKVAVRMSAPMVVRGRSPGHYQHERRGSTSSNGPGGDAGAGGGGYVNSVSSRADHMSMSSSTPMTQGNLGGYSGSYERSHHGVSSNVTYTSMSGLSGNSLGIPPPQSSLSHDDYRGIMDRSSSNYYTPNFYDGSGTFQKPSLNSATSLSNYACRDSSVERDYKADSGSATGTGNYSPVFSKFKNEYNYKSAFSLPGVESLSNGDLRSKDSKNYRWTPFSDTANGYHTLLQHATEVDT